MFANKQGRLSQLMNTANRYENFTSQKVLEDGIHIGSSFETLNSKRTQQSQLLDPVKFQSVFTSPKTTDRQLLDNLQNGHLKRLSKLAQSDNHKETLEQFMNMKKKQAIHSQDSENRLIESLMRRRIANASTNTQSKGDVIHHRRSKTDRFYSFNPHVSSIS
jgi:hypothetical protein